MSNIISDDHIHDGHRARVRAKLIAHGPKIFETYELLEMLLFYVIPYKDTNPIAKRLLARFGSLDRVLSASAEELCTVSGIGERAAEMICSVGKIKSILGAEMSREKDLIFTDYEKLGSYFVDYFSGMDSPCVAVMALNNKMGFIDSQTVYRIGYGSGAVQPKPFLDMAIKNRASIIVTAHNNPFGTTVPTPADRETNYMLSGILKALGVKYLEHFIVAGDDYRGIMSRPYSSFRQTPELKQFMDSRDKHFKNEENEAREDNK